MASSCLVNFIGNLFMESAQQREGGIASHWSCISSVISVQALIAIFSLIEWDDLELWSPSQGKPEGRLMDMGGRWYRIGFCVFTKQIGSATIRSWSGQLRRQLTLVKHYESSRSTVAVHVTAGMLQYLPCLQEFNPVSPRGLFFAPCWAHIAPHKAHW